MSDKHFEAEFDLRERMDNLRMRMRLNPTPAPVGEQAVGDHGDDLTIAYMAGGHDARKELAAARAEIERLKQHGLETINRLGNEVVDQAVRIDTLVKALRAAQGHLADDLNNTAMHPIADCPVLSQVNEALDAAEQFGKGK